MLCFVCFIVEFSHGGPHEEFVLEAFFVFAIRAVEGVYDGMFEFDDVFVCVLEHAPLSEPECGRGND